MQETIIPSNPDSPGPLREGLNSEGGEHRSQPHVVVLDSRFRVVASIPNQPGAGRGEEGLLRLVETLSAGDHIRQRVDTMVEDSPHNFEWRDTDGEPHSFSLTKTKMSTGLGEELLFVIDTTAQLAGARELADLVNQQDLKLQEMRHRMSNGLQIIASILRIKTHLARSPEVRAHLDDVHRRVLSIAALEDQLDPLNGVASNSVRPYLIAVCQRLAASLIEPSTGIELQATSADVQMAPDMIIAIGLVVTELVINALKHGFGGAQDRGTIQVALTEDGPSWTLCVADSGVGCRKPTFQSSSGLGTRIVRALARRLNAELDISPNVPRGLKVMLTYPRRPGPVS